MNTRNAAQHAAFTLVELLVVISLVVLLMALAVPSMSKIAASTNEATAEGRLGAAVALARAKAGLSPVFQSGMYQGTGIIFTNSGQMRIVRHTDGTNLRDGANQPLNPDRAAYVDTGPYVYIPEGLGVAGIARGGTGTVKLLSPPFAIRFNPKGMSVARSANLGDPGGLVHYDTNSNDRYVTGQNRSNNFDPEAYDPESGDYDVNNRVRVDTNGDGVVNNNDSFVNLMPTEAIETCVGVILYRKPDFWDAFPNGWPDGGDEDLGSAVADWIDQNGTVFYFNHYTGSPLRVPR